MQKPFFKRKQLTERNERSAVSDGLRSIYVSDDSAMDFSRLERHRHRPFVSFLKTVFVSALMAAIAFGVYWFVRQHGMPAIPGRFGEEQVHVTIDAPQTVKSGDVFLYHVTVENAGTVALTQGLLTIRLPDAFRLMEARPDASDTTHHQWSLPALYGGARTEIELKGMLLATDKTASTLTATYQYTPESFQAEFRTIASATTTVSGSVLALTINGPDGVRPGETVTYTATLKHTGTDPIAPLNVSVEPPQGFVLTSTEPPTQLVDKKAVWTIDSMAEGQTREYIVQGSFIEAPAQGADSSLTAHVDAVSDAAGTQTLVAVTHPVKRQYQALTATLMVNGSAAQQSVSIGDSLIASLELRNNSDQTMTNIEPRMDAASLTGSLSKLIDWSRFTDAATLAHDDQGVHWTSAADPKLASLSPNQSVTLTVTLPLTSQRSAGVEDGADLKGSAVFTSPLAKDPSEITSNTVRIGLTTPVAFAAEAFYFTDDNIPVGKGPHPPVVGSDTTYRIKWDVTTTSHALLTMAVHGQLPSNVRWSGFARVTNGTIQYDATTRQLVWSVPRLNTSTTPAEALFDVTITPTSDQRGTTPSLIQSSTLTGNDEQTSASVETTQPALTTKLDGDQFAQGDGRVK